jgi:hypothetical protein
MQTVRYSQPIPEGASRTVRTNTLLAAAFALTLCAGACGDDATPAPTTTPSSRLQSLAPGQLPTASPGAATGTVRSGNAVVQLSGDLTGTVQLLMLGPPALYSPPPGSTAVTWTDGAQTLGITGSSFTGEQPTSETLSLNLEVRNGAESVLLASTAGECTITVDTAAVGSLAGSFSCTDLAAATAAGDALSVDATGTFTASG